MDWSYNQINIIEYVKIYNKTINFWKKKYGNSIYEIDYENLIKDKGVPDGFPTQEELNKQLMRDTIGAVGSTVGANIGSTMFDSTFD